VSFEAVLGNKEFVFVFVVSEVTQTVLTIMCSTSEEQGVLVSVTGSGLDSHQAQTVSLALLTSSTSLLSGQLFSFFNCQTRPDISNNVNHRTYLLFLYKIY
jgi:hypothetical protein